jgi:hypothetical protein
LYKPSAVEAKSCGAENTHGKNMSKSAKGRVEERGENAAAKRGLTFPCLALGWGIFFKGF